MIENVLKIESCNFGIRIVKLCQYLQNERKEFVLSKKLLRRGTVIGALIRGAEYGQSKVDFKHKLTISLREANETEYWIDKGYRLYRKQTLRKRIARLQRTFKNINRIN